MPPRRDPHLIQRARYDARLRAGERKVHAALIDAMTRWLDTARALVLHQPVDVLTAAADNEPPDIDNVQASFAVWARALTENVEPVLAEAFGEQFRAESRIADISPVHYQERHMAEVHDRLVIWPEGAFEELRPELLEAMAEGESIDQVQDRIGMVLGIDAPARRVRADISEIDRKLADEETPRQEIGGLKARRRQLWDQHEERNLEWQWKARRIARTEIQGAMNAGTLAAAQAREDTTGEALYKAWLATSDERTRLTHAVAEGQMVRLRDPFTVGVSELQHPADPFGPAHETINCRCSMRILTGAEMQSELQGIWGGRGVAPRAARLGPDDTADTEAAVARLKRELAGEVVDEPTPTDRTPDDRTEADSRRDADRVAAPADGPELDVDVLDDDDPGPDVQHEVDDDGDDRAHTVDGVDRMADPEDPEDDHDPDADPDEGDSPSEAPAPAVLVESAATPQRVRAVEEWLKVAPADSASFELADDLTELIDASTVVDDVEVWHGIPDSTEVFGIANGGLNTVVGSQVTVPEFLPTTLAPNRAPSPTGGGAVNVSISVPAGTPGLWLPSIPDTDLPPVLLLAAGTVLAVTAVTYGENPPTVEAEVVPPTS
ncbi:hypothetical protein CH302_19380 [Rhodococcus sp. 15-2388-1-1a]|uniref:phage minor head protein n=1 Tax=Nocardiaceae TaxID=85025 RepID=UPI00068E22EF|nr:MULTISPECIES: phage minor head protein [Rhodococcus]OZE95104.1 hypothetical protein CH302_19380 [Rhodococcus sp. 15-2388-1-1a]